MATIQMRLENADAVYAKLKALPDEKAPKFMRMMVSDMKSRGPTLIAKTGASVYNIAAAKLNPKTKAGSTKAHLPQHEEGLHAQDLDHQGVVVRAREVGAAEGSAHEARLQGPLAAHDPPVDTPRDGEDLARSRAARRGAQGRPVRRAGRALPPHRGAT